MKRSSAPSLVLTLALLLAAGPAAPSQAAELRVGTCQFPVSADVAANGEWHSGDTVVDPKSRDRRSY